MSNIFRYCLGNRLYQFIDLMQYQT